MNKCPRLKLSPNHRYLVHEDGTPFFWLGDTAWELFHKPDKNEALEYLSLRSRQQFNVVQAVALSEFEGLTVPNAYGRVPLKRNESGVFDPSLPDLDGEYTYWDHVDFIIDAACSFGIYVALLPTWGDKFNLKWGKGPEIFTPDNALQYGRWIGNRYKDRSNIVWIMGGDRPIENETHRAIVNNMAEGIRECTGDQHLFSYHSSGFSSSSAHVHHEKWLDFNLYQTGHGGFNIPTYSYVGADYALTPVKPAIDGEPRYEDHAINFDAANGYFDDYDVRVAAYWATFAGAFGHTYGHHCAWSFTTKVTEYFIMDWKTALRRPGAEQMKYLKALLTSRRMLDRVPCQEALCGNYEGANYIAATRGTDHAFFYSPCGLRFEVDSAIFQAAQISACWYDPRNGAYRMEGIMPGDGTLLFTPPTAGRNHDWVLVLDFLELIQ